MSNYNANYLMNGNRLSTKVHYAPGGASSLSLAWDDTPTNRFQRPKVAQNVNGYYKQQTEPMQGYSYQSPQLQQQKPNKNYYEPQTYESSPLQDSNRILEAELQYYKNRNKLLQHNGYDSPEFNNYPKNQPAMQLNQYPNKIPQQANYGYQQNSLQQPKYSNHPDQLDIALHQHRQRQQSSSSSQYSQYKPQQYVPQNQERTSVKVNNPPGGRSNIIFG